MSSSLRCTKSILLCSCVWWAGPKRATPLWAIHCVLIRGVEIFSRLPIRLFALSTIWIWLYWVIDIRMSERKKVVISPCQQIKIRWHNPSAVVICMSRHISTGRWFGIMLDSQLVGWRGGRGIHKAKSFHSSHVEGVWYGCIVHRVGFRKHDHCDVIFAGNSDEYWHPQCTSVLCKDLLMRHYLTKWVLSLTSWPKWDSLNLGWGFHTGVRDCGEQHRDQRVGDFLEPTGRPRYICNSPERWNNVEVEIHYKTG